uniref:UDP-glucuronosyltransferase n=1 Tax=Romanomermis culicivorax TaxID=13658 RepID=A0A915K2Z3_ROMCU
ALLNNNIEKILAEKSLVSHFLGKRGHNVTIFMEGFPGMNKQPGAKESENVTNHVFILEDKAHFAEIMSKDLQILTWRTSHTSSLGIIVPWRFFGLASQGLIERNRSYVDRVLFQEKWDLVFNDAIFAPMGIVTALKTNSPLAFLSTTALQVGHMIHRPLPHPWSYAPTFYMDSHVYDHKIFSSRLKSFLADVEDVVITAFVDHFVTRPQFSKIHPAISLDRFFGRSKFVVLAFPQILDYVRPSTRDLVYSSGSCNGERGVSKSDALEGEIKQFVDDPASKGTIVVAFGHIVKWSQAPRRAKLNFVEALNSLEDYRIVWQFDEDRKDYSIKAHILTMAWIPQDALLHHKRTQLFISHGGLKSITETICAGVPALVIPFFAEQIRNAHLLEKSGVGLVVSKLNLTSDVVIRKSLRILEDGQKNFKFKIDRLRSFMNDQIIDSNQNAIFWTEFFLRHNGEIYEKNFFRLRATYMTFFQYLMIDVLSSILILMMICFVAIRMCFKVRRE